MDQWLDESIPVEELKVLVEFTKTKITLIFTCLGIWKKI